MCACATARQAARIITLLYDARLRQTGLEAPQFALLQTLHLAGPCSQTALGSRYDLDKTTVSRNLKVLERNGWIEPAPSADKRRREFVLTPSGRKRLAAAKPEWMKVQNELRATMSDENWSAMFRAFKTVARSAKALHEKGI
jgi:DNA-binding MarR family transcriptional regulator